MKYNYIKIGNFSEEYLNSGYKQKINELIKSIDENGLLKGIGKPEYLKYKKVYSRRINDKDRLLYTILKDTKTIALISCQGHYNDH